MPMGSSGPPGRCDATFSVPPCLMFAIGAVVVLPPATVVVAPPPAVVVAPPTVVPGDDLLSLPHAAMTLPISAALRPNMLPLVTNERREMLPFVKESIRPASSGPTPAAAWSNDD
jgi:hypothetical protein